MKIFLLSFFCCLIGTAQAQETRRVLFLGNSYTYFNSYAVATVMQQFALEQGDTVIYSANAPGGYTFQGHSTNATSLSLIRQGNWDFVVLQEQSQLPSFPPSQVQSDVYPYAAALNDSILKYNPCAETVFFMTWGRKNGDASNCANYPPLCTYYGMQQRLRTSYLEMAVNNEAICAPVGAAWQLTRSMQPSIELYVADESHPSYAGSYLAASVFYATLFRRSPENSAFYGSLPDSTAQFLQWAAAKVVLDSIDLWHIQDYDVEADFSFVANAGEVDFLELANAYANQYAWDFGDGNTSSDANPTHLYTADGVYTVRLVAADTCGHSDTISQNLVVQCLTPTGLLADFEANTVGSDTIVFVNNSQAAVSYFWDFGDGNTSSDAHPTHVYSNAGMNTSFEVTLVVSDSCGATDTLIQTVWINQTMGWSDAKNPTLILYPNPSSDGHFHLQAETNIQSLRLMDMLGRTQAVYLDINTTVFDFYVPEAGLWLVEIDGVLVLIARE